MKTGRHNVTSLVQLLTGLGRREGAFSTAIRGLHLINSSRIETPRITTEGAVFCLVVQGKQRLRLNEEDCVLDSQNYLVIGLPLPLVGEIVIASKRAPCLGIYFDLDLKELASLVAEQGNYAGVALQPQRGLFLGRVNQVLVDAVFHLVALLKNPEEISSRAPALRLRLLQLILQAPESHFLLRPLTSSSPARRLEKSMEWIRKRSYKAVRIDDLAKVAKMSQSGTFVWFKGVTTMTPLQFQKQLRLVAARRMLVTESVDTALVSRRVGYESANQFSREYRRFFGSPPLRDAKQLGAFRDPR